MINIRTIIFEHLPGFYLRAIATKCPARDQSSTNKTFDSFSEHLICHEFMPAVCDDRSVIVFWIRLNRECEPSSRAINLDWGVK